MKRYVESRYLSRLKPQVELSIYRTLWKLVFRVEDEKCKKNRNINLQTLEVIGNRNRESILDKITGEKDYYSNISSKEQNLNFLVFYLSKNPTIYNLLNEDAKLKVQHHVENTNIGKICGSFLKQNLDQYYKNILCLIKDDTHLSFSDEQLEYLLNISDTQEWQYSFCCILSSYYGVSRDYNQADARFQQAISPYLKFFDKEALVFLIERIENNDQLYRRARAIENHKEIKKKLVQLGEEEFDLIPYPHFKSNVA